jgi:hypothetical protein
MGGMNEDGNLALLPELIDRSFGAGPTELPSPVQRLAEGRRVLRRRRRLGLAATSAAVVAAIGVGVGLAGAGSERGADGPPPPLATSGTTSSASPTEDPSVSADSQAALDRLARKARQQAHRLEQQYVDDQFPASLGAGDGLVVKDGWRITQRIEEPMGFQPPEASLGVVVTDGKQTRWMLLTLENMVDGQGRPTGAQAPTAAADPPGKGYSRFEDWLASMVELNGGARTPALLTVDAADELRPGPGAEVVEVRSMPVVEGYSSQGDRMAEVRRDGRTWFVVVRGHGADAEVIPVDADLLPAPTFDAFLDHVRSQAASGEGLR